MCDLREKREYSTRTLPPNSQWPGEIARLHNGVREITTGDGIRAAARDVVEIAVEPPRAGRLSLRLGQRAGLDKATTSDWVQREHEAALRRLADAVATMKAEA